MGRKRILGNAGLRKLKVLLAGGPDRQGYGSDAWHPDTILELIRTRIGVSCRPRTLERILRKIHPSYRRRRPVPHSSVSKEE